MRRFPYMLAAFGIATALPISASVAGQDRSPTAEEKAKIEDILRQKGFASWKDIEADGKVWDVDDAVGSDGKTYDLELAMDSLQVTKQEVD